MCYCLISYRKLGGGLKMKRQFIWKLFFLVTTFAFFAISSSNAQPPVQTPKSPATPASPVGPIPPSPGVTIPDTPNIIEFTGEPVNFIPGQQMTFRWRVEPGAGGSPISSIRISAGGSVLHSSSSPSGNASFYILPPLMRGDWPFVLTAANRAGRSSTRTITLHALNEDQSKEMISRSTRLRAEVMPRSFPAPSTSDAEFRFIVNVSLNNSSSIRMRGVNIIIRSGGGIPTHLGILRDQTINPGTSSYRIECSGSSRKITLTETSPRWWGFYVTVDYEGWGRPVKLKEGEIRMVEKVSYEYLDYRELSP
jgi:hypothetical protein